MNWYQWTVNSITIVGMIWSLVFIADYWRLSQGLWVHNEYGRFFMAFPTAMFLLLTFILVAKGVDDITTRRVVGIVVYSGLVINVPWLHRLMRLSMRRNSTRSMPESSSRDG